MSFYNPIGWFNGSSAEQTVLKEEISCAFFLEQLVELQQGPGEVMKGMVMRGCLLKIRLWPLPQHQLQNCLQWALPVAWPFPKSLAHIRTTWLWQGEGLPINVSLQQPFHLTGTLLMELTVHLQLPNGSCQLCKYCWSHGSWVSNLCSK